MLRRFHAAFWDGERLIPLKITLVLLTLLVSCWE